MAAVLKTVVRRRTGGSNPSASAKWQQKTASSLLERGVLLALCIAEIWRQFRGRRCRFRSRRRKFRSRRCRFRVSTAQVPKPGLNLHRESAFYIAPVALVSALKWNLRHLWLNLRRLSLNLRHRGASGFFRNSPADVRTKNRQSSAVAMYVHPHLQPVEGTSSDVRTKKQHSSTVSMYVHR